MSDLDSAFQGTAGASQAGGNLDFLLLLLLRHAVQSSVWSQWVADLAGYPAPMKAAATHIAGFSGVPGTGLCP